MRAKYKEEIIFEVGAPVSREAVELAARKQKLPRAVMIVLDALKGRPVEEAVPFKCADEDGAQRLYGQLKYHAKEAKLKIGFSRAGVTVFVYNVAEEKGE